jgi:NAD+ diphosphatase
MCGEKLGERSIGDDELVKYCFSCERPYFEIPSSCVLVLVMNEDNQVLLLKQNYISKTNRVLVSGYVNNGETLEETVIREVLEETGQKVEKIEYVNSYYYSPKELIMPGYIAYVSKSPFNNSKEVDELMWCEINEVNKYIERNNNMSGIHFDNVVRQLKVDLVY